MPISMAPPPSLAFPRLSLTMPQPMIALPDRADTLRPPPPPLVIRHAAQKHKAVVVLGATGTGKSRLAIDLALRFGGEVINSDKMQLYAGLDVATNKVSPAECAGVRHHLLGVVDCPDEDFDATDFRREAGRAAAGAAARGRVPVVAGGSNSYVEELIEGDRRAFRERYDCCFLWVDVQLPVLRDFVGRRVDDMCRRGLVDEVAAAFDPRRTDYSRGLWRAIGAPELDAYFRSTGAGQDERERMLAAAIDDIKTNTLRLACRQRGKIQRLARMWRVRRVDATEVFLKRGAAADEAWQQLVAAPCIEAVRSFMNEDQECRMVAAAGKASVFASAAGNASVFATATPATAVV